MKMRMVDAVSVVELDGGMDRADSEALERAVEEAADRGTCVVLDLRAVSGLTAPVMEVLAHSTRMARAHGATLLLANVGPAVASVLHLLGLDRLVPVLPGPPICPPARLMTGSPLCAAGCGWTPAGA